MKPLETDLLYVVHTLADIMDLNLLFDTVRIRQNSMMLLQSLLYQGSAQ